MALLHFTLEQTLPIIHYEDDEQKARMHHPGHWEIRKPFGQILGTFTQKRFPLRQKRNPNIATRVLFESEYLHFEERPRDICHRPFRLKILNHQ